MIVLSRLHGRLRCLLAMALLAWLMLALAPFGVSARMVPMQPVPAMATHASHDSMSMGGTGCCDDHGGQPGQHTTHTCDCALPCAGVLPATQAGLAELFSVAIRYAPPRPIEAPLSGFAPPLRPPLA